MAGVVDEQDGVGGGAGSGADALVGGDQGAADLIGGVAAEDDLVLAGHAADVGEQVGEALGIALGEAQRLLVGGTAVVADHDGVALGVGMGRGDGSDQPHRERGHDQAHRHAHEEREPVPAGTTGSLMGLLHVRAGSGGSGSGARPVGWTSRHREGRCRARCRACRE